MMVVARIKVLVLSVRIVTELGWRVGEVVTTNFDLSQKIFQLLILSLALAMLGYKVAGHFEVVS